MTESVDSGGQRHPQVFVVDSQVFPRQLPDRPPGPRLSLIHLLLTAALLGVFIEAGFICHLYTLTPQVTPEVLKAQSRTGHRESFQSSAHESNEISPGKNPQPEGKPAAFLQSDWPASGGDSVLRWRSNSFPTFLRGVQYVNNSLFFQQEGHYFIFSKVSHRESCHFFQHAVMRRTDSYGNKPIALMQSSRSPCDPSRAPCDRRGDSYLGGVFHLNRGDSVFVRVLNSSQVLYETHENFIGAFMI